MRLLAFLPSVALLSGCLGVPVGDEIAHAGLPTVCEYEYPDGTPVDCSVTLEEKQPAAAEPPAGWRCWETTEKEMPAGVAMWTDGDGHWGVVYWVPPGNETARFAAHLHTEASDEGSRHQRAGPTGFVPVPGTWTDEPMVHFEVDGFHTSGSLAAFNTSNLDLRVSEFQGDPWYVYRFPDGEQAYYFQSMSRFFEHWSPHDVAIGNEGFQLSIKIADGLSATLGGRGQFPQDMILWEQGLIEFCE